MRHSVRQRTAWPVTVAAFPALTGPSAATFAALARHPGAMQTLPAPSRPRGAVRVAAFALLLAGLGALGARPARPTTPSASFVVVVNAANSASALPKDEISLLFLKKVASWPSGDAVVAIDLPAWSPTRNAFSQAIHGKPASAVKSYWQTQVFTGRGVPPVERGSERDVIAAVAADPAAIGYVASTTPLPKGVKVVNIITQ